jgi:nitrite reductase/ring-hydroxylating ferredoxin subunit
MSDCVSCSRREFLSATTVAAVGTFLAACSSGSDAVAGPQNVNLTVTLANFAALNVVGGIAQVSSTGTPVAVVRTGASSYRAFSMVCPHQGTVIGITSSGFRCPNHGATFNANGARTGGERTSGLFEFTVTSNTTAGTITITS